VSTLIPFLLSAIVLCLIGLLLWGFKRGRNISTITSFTESWDHFQIWLLALAIFTMGVFLAYLLLTIPFGTR
jgi:hypothetical protein